MNDAEPGLYGDLLYRGDELVVVRALVGSVTCPDWAADVTEHGYLMFLNAVLDPATQQIYASGKANTGSNVVIVGPSGFKKAIPGGVGNYPSQLAIVDGHVVCYVVLSFTEYGRYDLAGTLLQTLPIPEKYHGTSQGIRFVDDAGIVRWGDETLAGIFEGLVIREWMERGGYTGGQGQDGGFALSGNGISTLYPSGTTFFPRIAVHDGELALLYVSGTSVCWDTLTLPLHAAPLPPIPLPPQAPKITNTKYDPLLKAGTPWQATFDSMGTSFRIEINAAQQLKLHAVNVTGEDHTGLVRQLRIEGPSMSSRFGIQFNIGTKDMVDVYDDVANLKGVEVVTIPIQNILNDASNPQIGPNTWPNLVDHDVVRKLFAAGIKLNVEGGAVKDGDCTGQAFINEMHACIQRVRDAGGEVAAMSMDEPITNSSACHLSLGVLADRTAAYIKACNDEGVGCNLLEAWPNVPQTMLEQFTDLLIARGAKPDVFGADIDWNREHNDAKTAKFIKDMQWFMDQRGVVLRLFVNSTKGSITPDAIHHQNLLDLAKKIVGIHPGAQQVNVASWAFRTDGGPQDVPNCLGQFGLLDTFNAVKQMFVTAAPPVPEPVPPSEGDEMFAKFIDPATGVLTVKEVKASSQSGCSLLILADFSGIDQNGNATADATIQKDKVYSEQPGGKAGWRNPGADGQYERCTRQGNTATFFPDGHYYTRTFTLVNGL